MPANLIVPLTQAAYNSLVNHTDPLIAAARTDPIFMFDAAAHAVEIHGEFRDLGLSEGRRKLRDELSADLREPEVSVEKFGTVAYKLLVKQRRDQARASLAAVAPPLAVAPQPVAHGVTGAMDAAQGSQHMLANTGGLVVGYDHADQPSKDFTTALIKKSGGAGLKHLFVEELSSDLQADINAFMASPGAEMSPALVNRLKELQDGRYAADFEPMLHAAREKGVKLWGIDSPKADPLVGKDDPRYHERRLAMMNAEAKRVFDHVRATYPNEPFMALTGQMHVNTADGGVPGLSQIMGVPGFSFNADSNRLAFSPEDHSKRAAVSPLERECAEAIMKRAATDYAAFLAGYKNTPAYTQLADPKPALNKSLDQVQVTLAAQALAARFTAGGRLNQAADITNLVADASVTNALTPIYAATIVRDDRRAKLLDAVKTGVLAQVQTALNADPYLAKIPVDDAKEDTLLHLACEAGKPAIVQELVNRGMNPNAVDLKGMTPMHRALGKRAGAVPSAADLAGVVDHLLAAQANPNLADPLGTTGLDLAKAGPLADPQVVESFVNAGAAPARELFLGKFVAEAKSRYVAVKAMGGAQFDAVQARQAATTLADNLPGQGLPLGSAAEVATAMTHGTVIAELGRLTTLLQNRAQHMQALVDGIKAKDLGKLRGALDADPRLAHIEVDFRDGRALGTGLTALASAAMEGNGAAIDELVNQRGIDINQKSPAGRTALHEVLSVETAKTNVAGQKAMTARAKELIRRNADVNARTAAGETALHIAGFNNNVPMLEALAELNGTNRAADPDARDNRGWTPLDTTMAATNREAEQVLHREGMGGTAPPLKAGPLSTVDILSQSTLCQDENDTHKARKFYERLYANADLRPMLDLAAAAACNDRDPPNGGLRLVASKTNVVGPLYGQSIGATAAYDEKVNSLLFPLADDGKEGEAVGSLAHELTHMTAHLVSNDPATLPFTDKNEKKAYFEAINADVRKLQLLDDENTFQRFIKNRFSGRMETYKNKSGTQTPKTGEEFDESLLQEFIVGVPQVAAVYGMDELQKHMPGLVKFYKDVWVPKMQDTLANDPRFANGRAKIDTAANQQAAQVLGGHPSRQVKTVARSVVQKSDDRLQLDALMAKIEADFLATKGRPKITDVGGRTVNYKTDDFALDAPDRKDFEKKKATIRAAVSAALKSDSFPRNIDQAEIRTLVETVTTAVTTYSGDDFKKAVNNRTANWVKDAKITYIDRRVALKDDIDPKDLAEAIVFRAEAKARAHGADADLDPETDVKESKQKDLIKNLTKTLSEPGNANKLKDPHGLIDAMSGALAAQGALYQKPKAKPGHVSVDVKQAKRVWIAQLATM